MSQHRSLRAAATLGGKRNVLKRFERVEVLKKRGQWKDGRPHHRLAQDQEGRLSQMRNAECGVRNDAAAGRFGRLRRLIPHSALRLRIQMVRLQKFLADAGVASRRAGEQIILAGRVAVNGETVPELGTRIDPVHDRVAVDGKPVRAKRKLYVALNKPPRPGLLAPGRVRAADDLRAAAEGVGPLALGRAAGLPQRRVDLPDE